MNNQRRKATLEDAIALALAAHRGQADKAGAPYILHPLRLMVRMSAPEEMIVAVLHDVVEDGDCRLSDLRDAGFSDEVVAAVDCLTRRAGESYEEFIARAATNPLARKVKIADLEDNMDVRRLPNLNAEDVARLRKYRASWSTLTGS